LITDIIILHYATPCHYIIIIDIITPLHIIFYLSHCCIYIGHYVIDTPLTSFDTLSAISAIISYAITPHIAIMPLLLFWYWLMPLCWYYIIFIDIAMPLLILIISHYYWWATLLLSLHAIFHWLRHYSLLITITPLLIIDIRHYYAIIHYYWCHYAIADIAIIDYFLSMPHYYISFRRHIYAYITPLFHWHYYIDYATDTTLYYYIDFTLHIHYFHIAFLFLFHYTFHAFIFIDTLAILDSFHSWYTLRHGSVDDTSLIHHFVSPAHAHATITCHIIPFNAFFISITF